VSNQEEVATRQISGKIGNAKAHHYNKVGKNIIEASEKNYCMYSIKCP
jgi:hypothetical protein